MALPTILIDSATGSDAAASGAGPGTALTGTNASTSGDGLTVTLDGSPDLSGVATDGSHVIYLADATAGARNFGKITAKDNGAKTVTVANAFGLTLSGLSWAIGGKRASLLSATSAKLIENNGTSGDAMPGWAMEMASGHTETRASTINPRRAGDTTDGPIIIRGASGAGTMPILTFSNNGDSFTVRAQYWTLRDFEMRNSNATKTASIAVETNSGNTVLRNIRCNHATNKYYQFFNTFGTNSDTLIDSCDIRNCANVGITQASAATNFRVWNCVIASCGSHAIANSGNSARGVSLIGNIIAYNTGDGLNISGTPGTISLLIRGNVFHGNADGVEISTNFGGTTPAIGATIENNEFSFHGAYGVNLSGSGYTDAGLSAVGFTLRNNAFYSNTSGKYNGITSLSQDEVTTDPSSGSATATKDYAGTVGGTNFMSGVHEALGYPNGGTLAVGTGSSSYNYQDIGLQHADAGGSSRPGFVIGGGCG